MHHPGYTLPPQLFPGLLASLVFSRPRSFQADARLCLRHLTPPAVIQGETNIPTEGPCALTVNHYHRPGFGAWWIALGVSAVVPRELRWIMTAEWTFPGRWYGFVGRPASRWVLKRLAKIYGFFGMPPMPPRPHEIEARARSVRGVLEYTRHHPRSMLALSPEGGDTSARKLALPPPGVGRFMLLLAKQDIPFIPVGCWEEQGRFQLRFGEAYRLQDASGEACHRDLNASAIVMRAIARQLPEHLRGEFA